MRLRNDYLIVTVACKRTSCIHRMQCITGSKIFNSRTHCTKFQGEVSELADILASVVQGSGLGPAAYIVNAADPIYPAMNLSSSPMIRYYVLGHRSRQ